MQVQAKVLYPIIKSLNSGFYMWATLEEASILEISKLRCSVTSPKGFSWHNSTELHSTIIYSSGSLPLNPVFPPDAPRVGVIQNVLGWNDHNDRQIVVAQLNSPDLIYANTQLVEQGFINSHPQYVPHITLGKFKEQISTFEFRLFVQGLNDILYRYPISIHFGSKLFADSLC